VNPAAAKDKEGELLFDEFIIEKDGADNADDNRQEDIASTDVEEEICNFANEASVPVEDIVGDEEYCDDDW